MGHIIFSRAEYAKKKNSMSGDVLMEKAELVVRRALAQVIEPHYATGGGRGRQLNGPDRV